MTDVLNKLKSTTATIEKFYAMAAAAGPDVMVGRDRGMVRVDGGGRSTGVMRGAGGGGGGTCAQQKRDGHFNLAIHGYLSCI